MVVKDFLGNELEAGNTIAYVLNKDQLVLFKILEVLPDGRLRASRLDNNPTDKPSPPLGYKPYSGQVLHTHTRAIKLWLTFEEGKK